MTTYTVHFYTEAGWASHDIEADTPDQALALAQQFADRDDWALDFQNYDGAGDVEHIEVLDQRGRSVAAWRSEDLMLRVAASDLLEGLEAQTEAAQAVIDAWPMGDLGEAVNALEGCLSVSRRALTRAKEGAS